MSGERRHSSDQNKPPSGPYSLKPVPCQHRVESHRLILRAAEQTVPGRAVVLGAGPCDDIPLVDLADRFEHITLNDVDADQVHKALARMQLSDSQKVDLQIADLTGVTERLLGAIESGLATSTEPHAAIEQMAQALDDPVPGVFPLSGSYELVVASGVLSQLHFGLVHRAGDAFERRFPGQILTLRNAPRWATALAKVARRMEAKFLDDVAAMTAPGGRIYLSDSVQMCHVQLAPAGGWQTEGSYRMLRTTEITDYLDARFTIVERARWTWVVSPPIAAGQTGRVYDMQGLVLRISDA